MNFSPHHCICMSAVQFTAPTYKQSCAIASLAGSNYSTGSGLPKASTKVVEYGGLISLAKATAEHPASITHAQTEKS